MEDDNNTNDVTAQNEDTNDEPSGRKRRTSRAVQRYGHFDADPDDPDSGPDMRDSDDDPEFTAGAKNGNASEEEAEESGPGSARGSGATRGRGARGRKRKPSVPIESPAKVQATGTARRGRPASTVSPPKLEVKPYQVSADRGPKPYENMAPQPSSSTSGSGRPEPATTRYKNGDYLIAKKDIEEYRGGLNPPIWRIDGKSLLQKFTHFEKDGKIQYKNIPTYSGWTPASYHQYTGVKTKFVFQTKKDTTLELIDVIEHGDEAPPPERPGPRENKVWSNPIESRDYEIPDDMRLNKNAFKIYIQALISNALDTTFLKDVYDDNDEYFPPAIKKIENQGLAGRNKLLEVAKWASDYTKAIDTWPCTNIKNETNDTCSACSSPKATKSVQFYGRSYDSDSLSDRQADKGLKMKWPLCDRCGVMTSLYSKIKHHKYEHYDQSKIQVTNMRVLFPEEDTKIVEELLDNREWVMTLFKTMCQHIVRAEKFYSAEKDRLRREN